MSSRQLLLLLLLALLAVTHVAQGIVCARNICSTVRCANPTHRDCPHTLVKKGGFCGCCDLCIRILKEGEFCRASPDRRLQRVKCGDGLFCDIRTDSCQARKRHDCSAFIFAGPKPWNRCGKGFFCNRRTGKCQPWSN